MNEKVFFSHVVIHNMESSKNVFFIQRGKYQRYALINNVYHIILLSFIIWVKGFLIT